MTALAPRNKSLHITTHLINSLKLFGEKKSFLILLLLLLTILTVIKKKKKIHPRIKGIG